MVTLVPKAGACEAPWWCQSAICDRNYVCTVLDQKGLVHAFGRDYFTYCGYRVMSSRRNLDFMYGFCKADCHSPPTCLMCIGSRVEGPHDACSR